MSGLNRCSVSVDHSLSGLLEGQSALGAGVPLHLSRPVGRKIASLGHVFGKWALVRPIAARHLAREARLAPLRPWLEELHSEAPLIAKGEGLYASLLEIKGDTTRVVEPWVDTASLRKILSLLPRFVKSRVPALSAPCLEIAREADAPGWLALLRLRPMRELWDRLLRRSHLELLQEVLPDAWLLETGPLPPQAVIPRLELHDWSELVGVSATGRCFELVHPLHGKPLMDAGAVSRGELSQISTGAVLQETTRLPEANLVLAVYHRHGRRVDLAACLGLEEREGHWRVSWTRWH